MQARYDEQRRPERAPRILVVDDDPANLRLIRAYLLPEAFEVVTAASGLEALQRVADGVDLVILDIRMPWMNGFEVCRRIRQNAANQRLPVVFLTAELNDPGSELEGLEAGADEFLHKPVHRAALVARVRSLLRLANAERDRMLLDQLAQSEKLAAIGQIAAGVAHEINNPLAFMLSNLHTLRAYMADVHQVLAAWRQGPEQGRAMEEELNFADTIEDVDSIIRETTEGGQRVRAIVQGLKSFSRKDDAPAEPLDLADVVTSTLLLTEREITSRAQLTKALSPAPVKAAPRNKLEQVVLNHLVNALQALTGVDPQRSAVSVSTGAGEGYSWLSVSDTGCGIADEHKDRIFDPFFTTKPVGVGSGMGLSFCANVVQKLGGTIEVESQRDVGTTFTLKIPTS